VVAIINWDEVTILGKKKVRFGWFDVIDDIDAVVALVVSHVDEVLEVPMTYRLDLTLTRSFLDFRKKFKKNQKKVPVYI
jgi:hypothetical protein